MGRPLNFILDVIGTIGRFQKWNDMRILAAVWKIDFREKRVEVGKQLKSNLNNPGVG